MSVPIKENLSIRFIPFLLKRLHESKKTIFQLEGNGTEPFKTSDVILTDCLYAHTK